MDKYENISRAETSSYLKVYEVTAADKNAKSKNTDNFTGDDNNDNHDSSVKNDNGDKSGNAKNPRKNSDGFSGAVLRWLCAVAVVATVVLSGLVAYEPLQKTSDFIRDELGRKSIIRQLPRPKKIR